MDRRIVKFGIFGMLVAVGGATALARAEHGFHHGFWKAKVDEHIDGALDAAKVTPAQREAIHADRDRVFATFEENGNERGARVAKAIALFESDRIDPAAIAELRSEHQAEAKRSGDAIVSAIIDAHGVLTGPQRTAVVEYARAHRPPMMGGGKMEHGQWMKRIATNRIEAALNAAKVTEAQRATIDAARDRVFAALETEHQNPGAHLEEALDLFAADEVDQSKIAAIRAQHEERARRIGDVVVQAILEAHDALDSSQRHAIGDFVRAHQEEHQRAQERSHEQKD